MGWSRSTSIRSGLLALVVLLSVPAFGQEKVRLPVPITDTTETWAIADLRLFVKRATVVITLEGDTGKPLTAIYDVLGLEVNGVRTPGTPTGQQIIRVINKADFSTPCASDAARNCGTLERRIFDRLRDDGVISGVVEGTPQ